MVGFNWKNEKKYDFLKNANSSQLAFEFLRRNTAYQADYLAYSKLKGQLIKKYGDYETASEKWRSDPIMWELDPPIEDGESIAGWQKRVMTGGKPPKKEWLEFAYGSAYSGESGHPFRLKPTT